MFCTLSHETMKYYMKETPPAPKNKSKTNRFIELCKVKWNNPLTQSGYTYSSKEYDRKPFGGTSHLNKKGHEQ